MKQHLPTNQIHKLFSLINLWANRVCGFCLALIRGCLFQLNNCKRNVEWFLSQATRIFFFYMSTYRRGHGANSCGSCTSSESSLSFNQNSRITGTHSIFWSHAISCVTWLFCTRFVIDNDSVGDNNTDSDLSLADVHFFLFSLFFAEPLFLFGEECNYIQNVSFSNQRIILISHDWWAYDLSHSDWRVCHI